MWQLSSEVGAVHLTPHQNPTTATSAHCSLWALLHVLLAALGICLSLYPTRP